jgi:hypothetical protein
MVITRNYHTIIYRSCAIEDKEKEENYDTKYPSLALPANQGDEYCISSEILLV